MAKTKINFSSSKEHEKYSKIIGKANQAIHKMEVSIIQFNAMMMNIDAYTDSSINRIIKDTTNDCCKMIALTNDVRDAVQSCFYIYGDEGDIPEVYGNMLLGQYTSITNSADKLLEQFSELSSELRYCEIAKRNKPTGMEECMDPERESEDEPIVQSSEHPIETESLLDQEPQLNTESAESEKSEEQKNE